MNNLFFIWSNEHGAWWGPARCGYVRDIRKAGRYDHGEALEISRDANMNFMLGYTAQPNEIPISVSDAEFCMNVRSEGAVA